MNLKQNNCRKLQCKIAGVYVARRTRSSKRKLELHKRKKSRWILNPLLQNMSLQVLTEYIQGEWLSRGYNSLQEVKFDPETKTDDAPVEKSPQVRQSKGDKGKHVNYLSRPKTRPTNKLRLNSKALFKPSLKEDNLIILDEDNIEKIPKKTKKEKKQQPMPNIKSSHSEGEMEQDPTYTLEMHELPKLYTHMKYRARPNL
jgi:hypothetical protein